MLARIWDEFGGGGALIEIKIGVARAHHTGRHSLRFRIVLDKPGQRQGQILSGMLPASIAP